MSTSQPCPISVAVRLRPFVAREQGQEAIIKIDGNIVSLKEGENEKNDKRYAFDAAFDSMDPASPSYASQERVYTEFGRTLLDHALQGFNSTIFAYGQTGTGKTTTIMGSFNPVSEQGILIRLVNELFEEVRKLRADGYKVECRARMLEVYNEKIQDLLTPAHQKEKNKYKMKLDVHLHPVFGVYVPGLTDTAVETFTECADLITYGNAMKSVAATAMNAKSSRAHTLFIIRFEKNDGQDLDTTVSEIYFVDLAGRENERTTQVKGDRLIELSFINKSLFHLSTCIHSLSDGPSGSPSSPDKIPKDGASPSDKPSLKRSSSSASVASGASKKSANISSQFRNSKLTMLLSKALSGNSKTAMIGTLSPAASNLDENMSTLNFAATVKNIKLKVSASSVNKKDLVQSLQEEVQQLKEQLRRSLSPNAADEGEGADALADKLAATQSLYSQFQKSWEESQKEAEADKQKRERVMSSMGVSLWKAISRGKSTNALERDYPYIQNWSDDPHLKGTLTFHAPLDTEKLVGSADDCNFVLQGLGICKHHCYLNNDNARLHIRLAPAENGVQPRVEVNGTSLGAESVALQHHDCVLFGRSRAFHVITESDGSAPPPGYFDQNKAKEETLSNTELMKALLGSRADDEIQFNNAKNYCAQLQGMDGESTVAFKAFLRSAKKVKRMVDEANEITAAVRPGDRLAFELAMVAPPLSFGYSQLNLPIVAVRLVQHMSVGKKKWLAASLKLGQKRSSVVDAVHKLTNVAFQNSQEGIKEVALWSYARFEGRLQMMYDEYEAWSLDPSSYSSDPNLDPWKETGPAEAALLVREAEMKCNQRSEALAQARAEIEELKQQLKERDEDLKLAQERTAEWRHRCESKISSTGPMNEGQGNSKVASSHAQVVPKQGQPPVVPGAGDTAGRGSPNVPSVPTSFGQVGYFSGPDHKPGASISVQGVPMRSQKADGTGPVVISPPGKNLESVPRNVRRLQEDVQGKEVIKLHSEVSVLHGHTERMQVQTRQMLERAKAEQTAELQRCRELAQSNRALCKDIFRPGR